jgi:hypothetical protein
MTPEQIANKIKEIEIKYAKIKFKNLCNKIKFLNILYQFKKYKIDINSLIRSNNNDLIIYKYMFSGNFKTSRNILINLNAKKIVYKLFFNIDYFPILAPLIRNEKDHFIHGILCKNEEEIIMYEKIVHKYFQFINCRFKKINFSFNAQKLKKIEEFRNIEFLNRINELKEFFLNENIFFKLTNLNHKDYDIILFEDRSKSTTSIRYFQFWYRKKV